MKRRYLSRYLSEKEKMAIVLAGLKGEQSIAEICREHQISQSQYYNGSSGLPNRYSIGKCVS